ncbi:MAG: hypothetical protein JNM34_06125 [Chthonomonadaceae bacterium]|nr:hypothetical protein [Chthonomonadaceae bacterium]
MNQEIMQNTKVTLAPSSQFATQTLGLAQDETDLPLGISANTDQMVSKADQVYEHKPNNPDTEGSTKRRVDEAPSFLSKPLKDRVRKFDRAESTATATGGLQ